MPAGGALMGGTIANALFLPEDRIWMRTRRFSIIEIPFHMGLQDAGVGRGPARFLQAGVDQVFTADEVPAEVLHIRKRDGSTAGLDAVVDLNRQLRTAVQDSIARGICPVVLAGNCNSCLGTLAGMGCGRAGIVWLDAHGDFNTPETSLSGVLDGMALAAAVGHCHADLRERIGMEGAVREEDVLLLGWRDLDPAERTRLAASRVTARGAAELSDVAPLLADLSTRADAVYLHIDMDFLDPAESPGVNFRGPGGVPLSRAETLVAVIASALPLAAIAVTNHNPEHDPARLTPAAGLRLLRAIASASPFHAPQ
jgi:arginase